MKIVIPGKPIPKARPRVGSRGQWAIVYDPQQREKKEVKEIITNCISAISSATDKEMQLEVSKLSHNQSLVVTCVFYQSVSDRLTNVAQNAKLWGFEQPIQKPDVDNLLKFYLDCGNGILWHDDSQIISCTGVKKFSKNPRTEIEIMPFKEIKLHPKAEGIMKIFGPDELKEFLRDVWKITALHPSQVDEISDNREIWLTTAARFLSDFAEKHTDRLKKIRKYDGLSDDIRRLDEQRVNLLAERYP